MTWPIGAKPPLHSKFDEQQALDMIRRRYAEVKKRIPRQVTLLQANAEFRLLCKWYYGNGYKDWFIVMAIFNCVLNWRIQHVGLDLRVARSREQLLQLSEEDVDVCYPAWRFSKEELESAIAMFNMTALGAYGFQLRRHDYNPDVVERFLRERMNHFELDLPHRQLFGDPPGDWPET